MILKRLFHRLAHSCYDILLYYLRFTVTKLHFDSEIYEGFKVFSSFKRIIFLRIFSGFFALFEIRLVLLALDVLLLLSSSLSSSLLL